MTSRDWFYVILLTFSFSFIAVFSAVINAWLTGSPLFVENYSNCSCYSDSSV